MKPPYDQGQDLAPPPPATALHVQMSDLERRLATRMDRQDQRIIDLEQSHHRMAEDVTAIRVTIEHIAGAVDWMKRAPVLLMGALAAMVTVAAFVMNSV